MKKYLGSIILFGLLLVAGCSTQHEADSNKVETSEEKNSNEQAEHDVVSATEDNQGEEDSLANGQKETTEEKPSEEQLAKKASNGSSDSFGLSEAEILELDPMKDIRLQERRVLPEPYFENGNPRLVDAGIGQLLLIDNVVLGLYIYNLDNKKKHWLNLEGVESASFCGYNVGECLLVAQNKNGERTILFSDSSTTYPTLTEIAKLPKGANITQLYEYGGLITYSYYINEDRENIITKGIHTQHHFEGTLEHSSGTMTDTLPKDSKMIHSPYMYNPANNNIQQIAWREGSPLVLTEVPVNHDVQFASSLDVNEYGEWVLLDHNRFYDPLDYSKIFWSNGEIVWEDNSLRAIQAEWYDNHHLLVIKNDYWETENLYLYNVRTKEWKLVRENVTTFAVYDSKVFLRTSAMELIEYELVKE
ncbi:hypothetical protein [Litchfieldia alkalitelluris]|uniref:hypothetical protein n=1 Tax=Litchfieldia alkalitelluris TaxID=304268 RepID=UPI000996CE11|nr:hypothetical protein [Litchfieldia alkalitelluris]